MIDISNAHDTRQRAVAQAQRLRRWVLGSPWAALALLLGAGMLCGAAVRSAIGAAQLEAFEAEYRLAQASPDLLGQWLTSGEAAAVTGHGRDAGWARRVAGLVRSGQGGVLAAAPRAVDGWQEGVERNPRKFLGHNDALARHGPSRG